MHVRAEMIASPISGGIDQMAETRLFDDHASASNALRQLTLERIADRIGIAA